MTQLNKFNIEKKEIFDINNKNKKHKTKKMKTINNKKIKCEG